jgi:integrase
VQKVAHLSALPFTEIHEFVTRLRKREGLAARALEFTILCAARTGEVLGMKWNEIDITARRWTIPAARMEAGREHIVPLSDRAIAILELVPRTSAYIFPNQRGHKMSEAGMSSVLKRMKINVTVHGFRSSFSDWAAEKTTYQHAVREMALAHAISSAIERSYRRGDLLEKRARLMQDWAKFIEMEASRRDARVIAIRCAP